MTGLSISTSSILNFSPPGAVHSCPALNPLFASTIGAQPAQTFRANRTVLLANLYPATPCHRRQLLGGLETVFFDCRRARCILARFGRLRNVLGVDPCLPTFTSAWLQPAWERLNRCGKSQMQSAQGQRAPTAIKKLLFGFSAMSIELRLFMLAERLDFSLLARGRIILYDRVLPGTLPFNEPPQVISRASALY